MFVLSFDMFLSQKKLLLNKLTAISQGKIFIKPITRAKISPKTSIFPVWNFFTTG